MLYWFHALFLENTKHDKWNGLVSLSFKRKNRSVVCLFVQLLLCLDNVCLGLSTFRFKKHRGEKREKKKKQQKKKQKDDKVNNPPRSSSLHSRVFFLYIRLVSYCWRYDTTVYEKSSDKRFNPSLHVGGCIVKARKKSAPAWLLLTSSIIRSIFPTVLLLSAPPNKKKQKAQLPKIYNLPFIIAFYSLLHLASSWHQYVIPQERLWNP